MYMHDKLLRARGIIYTVGLGIVVIALAVWKLVLQ
jgi:hypothetical protein